MVNRLERHGRSLSLRRDVRKRFPESVLQHTPALRPPSQTHSKPSNHRVTAIVCASLAKAMCATAGSRTATESRSGLVTLRRETPVQVIAETTPPSRTNVAERFRPDLTAGEARLFVPRLHPPQFIARRDSALGENRGRKSRPFGRLCCERPSGISWRRSPSRLPGRP
jgi:hypothetical protein